MTPHFEDIVSQLGEPQWWMGPVMVPRYNRFHPRHLPKLEQRFAVLYEAICNQCGAKFQIGCLMTSPYSLPSRWLPYHESRGKVCSGQLHSWIILECYEMTENGDWRTYPISPAARTVGKIVSLL